MSSSSYVTTVGGYVAVAAIGLTLYYSTQKSKKGPAAPPSKAPRSRSPEPRKDKKSAKKQRVEQYAQEASSQKPAPAPAPAEKRNGASVSKAAAKDDGDDELNNKEFARQLSSVKQGKQFVAKSGSEQKRQKSVKQSRAQVQAFDDAKPSPPSSTAGIDADDDESPASSPKATAADAGDVSDMLETPANGPASLRIVPSETPKTQKAKKEKKAAEPALTKKQRQNRKKAENAKAENDEAEAERKKLMEAQRRLARVSEGRAAKDGSQFMASVNGGSAWTAGKPNGQSAPAAAAAAPLLDTFDQAPAAKPAPAPAAKPAKADGWISSLPSEEEQLERLKSEAEADEWSTVKSSKAKKAKKATNSADEKVEAAAPSKASEPAKAPEPVQKTQVPNGKPAITKNYGSFSALSTQGPEEEEEQEQEWDV